MPTDPYAAYLTPPAAPAAADSDDPYAAYLAPPAASAAPDQTASGPLTNVGDESLGQESAKIAGTAGIEGLADIPGMLGNVGQLNNYAVAGLESGLGHALPSVFPQYNQDYQTLLQQGNQARQNSPVMSGLAKAFPTGDTIASTAANTLGSGLYVPSPDDPIGQAALSTARAGIGMIGPGVLGEGARAASLGKDILSADTASKIAGSLPATMAKGAVAGGTGEVTNQTTGDPLAGALVGAVVPEAAGATLAKVGPSLSWLGSPGAKTAADARMYNTATDPVAALQTANTQPDLGVPTTLAEQTQDPGIAAAQKLLVNQAGDGESKISPVATAVQDVQEQQNTARTGLVNQNIPGNADVMAPSALFQNAKNQAEARAAVANAITPTASDLDASGGALRGQIDQENQNAGDLVNALYETVRQSDPAGEFNIFTQPAARQAQSMINSFDAATEDESPIAQPVIEKVAALPDILPLNRLMKMDSTITNAMSAANRAGDLGGARQLTILKGNVMGALNDAIDAQGETDNLAVQQGQMSPADALTAKLQAISNGTDARTKIATGTGPSSTISQGTDGPSGGVRGNDTAGPGAVGSGPAVAPNAARGNAATIASASTRPTVYRSSTTGQFQAIPQNSIDPDTLDMLQAAKAFHAEREQTWRQGPVGAFLATNGYKGQYKTLDASGPGMAFPGGDKGYETTQNFLHAANNSPESVATMKDIALARLRNADEPITQKALDAWKGKYGTSLQAIDEHSPGFSSSFDHVAAANESAMAAAKGIPGKFIKFTDPNEAVKTIGTMIRAKDGPTQVSNLLKAVNKDPKSIGGVRAAAMEDLKDHGTNQGIWSYPKVANYMRSNRGSLEALFGKNSPEMNNLDDLAASLKTTQDAENLGNTKGTAYTTRGLSGFLKKAADFGSEHDGKLSVGSLLSLVAAEQIGAGDFGWKTFGSVAGLTVTRQLFKAMKSTGAKSINDLYMKGFEDPEVGKAMIQRVLDKNGSPQPKLIKAAVQGLATSLRASQVLSAENKNRQPRASGGRANDPKFEKLVQRLMTLAEKAKKKTAHHTEPLLGVSDNLIAKALEVSNRAI